jgi:hypothetical protein
MEVSQTQEEGKDDESISPSVDTLMIHGRAAGKDDSSTLASSVVTNNNFDQLIRAAQERDELSTISPSVNHQDGLSTMTPGILRAYELVTQSVQGTTDVQTDAVSTGGVSNFFSVNTTRKRNYGERELDQLLQDEPEPPQKKSQLLLQDEPFRNKKYQCQFAGKYVCYTNYRATKIVLTNAL